MMKTKKIKKTFRFILPMFAVGTLILPIIPTTSVQAEDNTEDLPVYEITIGQDSLLGDLKEQVITNRAETDENVNLDKIDVTKSTIDVDGLNTSITGIQSVTVKVNLINTDATIDTVGYSFVEEVAVNTKIDQAPRLVLKSDSVTVNNGDTFLPESYISYINDDSVALPALKVTSNVDTSTDGDYSVTYTAIDLQGNKTTQSLNVTVKTPQEVLDRIAAEEEAARLEAEEQARLEAEAEAEAQRIAEEEAAAQALANANFEGTGGISGSDSNPYYGGFSNCTAGAWLLAAQYSGVYLPNFGNAYQWLGSAQSYGYSTGSTPAAGSIVVMSNHVAYVTGVNADGTINIEEGGYNGGYMARTISATNDGTQNVTGFIYLN